MRRILARTLLPHHMWRWLRLLRTKRTPKARGDAELRLYHRILPGDFLHYGWFDDPDTPAGSIGFDDVHRAQLRYAEELAAMIEDPGAAVLDAGCGMGGMLALLNAAGRRVTGVTPDRFQVAHIRRAYPGIPLIESRFEDLGSAATAPHEEPGPAVSGAHEEPDSGAKGAHEEPGSAATGPPAKLAGPRAEPSAAFGAVIHSESIQYMDPDGVFAAMQRILAPGGVWIVADYFRLRARGHRSGWLLDDFRERLARHGFAIVQERDITANVLPTLAFGHLLATRLGLPAIDFATDKLAAKAPALRYILDEALARVRPAAADAIEVVDPAAFAASRRYMLFKLERASG